MNLDAPASHGSVPKQWEVPLRQLGAVQRSWDERTAVGQAPSERAEAWGHQFGMKWEKRCLLTSFMEQQWASYGWEK